MRLVVEYEGTAYCGWQRQQNGPSIQAALEAAIERITGDAVRVTGAGRTDAGVHALGQVAAFNTTSRLEIARLRHALCAVLPADISVVAADDVPGDFDPRFHALGKLYRYRLWNAQGRSPVEARFSWHRPHRLEVEAMNEAARALVGEHDFAAFRAADCERKTTVRRVSRLDVRRDGPLVTVEIEATAFLKNMVRIVTGTLVEVGRGRRPASSVAELIASRDRTQGGPTAPPQGLFLVRVDYALPLPPRA